MSFKVLIIDDDSRNIFALGATLKSKGFKCLTATSAQQGLAILRDDPEIGIVLLDMMMPEMDGYEAMPLLKQIREVPVIAVTAQAMVGDREKCIAAGANDYISKPINVDALLQILENRKK
jgi:two-component system cell cycle response regulator DivK